MKLNLYFTPYRKSNSTLIKDLNVKHLEENRGKLHDIGLGNYFLDMISEAQTKKKKKNTKINKLDYIKQTKNPCIAEETISEMKM